MFNYLIKPIKRLTNLILLLIIVMFFMTQTANGDSVDQGKVQAAYIYNFIKFTTWPEQIDTSSDKLNFCLFGEDNITEKLNELQGKRVQRKRIAINTTNTETSLENCHVLYISPGMYKRYKYLIDFVAGKPVLTVGNDSKLLKAGGIISLKMIEGKQKFEVNIQALTDSRLDMSSKVLALAIIEDFINE